MAVLSLVSRGLQSVGTRGLFSPTSIVAVQTRWASKKSGGSSKNHGGKSPGKRYGTKKLDGDFVHAGNILATQRLIRWHPGAHVGIGRNKTIFALEDGTVRFTKEVYVPDPESSDGSQVCRLPRGAIIYKTFINIVPTPQQARFKLVDML
ncbi:large ribosomal subunit protein bL27m [Ambystoma mexicanum]|uniref:large ribosomal subunit protein bL27m n=1 Tax=Ambystoma mexicanum TaxID=8296 RepID=UPI0037E71D6D